MRGKKRWQCAKCPEGDREGAGTVMRLDTINRWLRRLGLLLVVQVDDGTGDEPTVFRIIRARDYKPATKEDTHG